MVNTRTDAELAAAVQAAVDAMLPQDSEQVRERVHRTGARILVMDATKGTEVSNPTDLPTLVPSIQGCASSRDCKKNFGASSSGHADKKPDASGHVFELTQDQATNTSGFSLATIQDTTSVLDVSSIHDHARLVF
ncbi:hypothetical protein Tco_1311604 [Tanacetum coccineum]